ncbi:MAG: hypothetical protein AAB821_01960 [Patescibacteria group bacterium]
MTHCREIWEEERKDEKKPFRKGEHVHLGLLCSETKGVRFVVTKMTSPPKDSDDAWKVYVSYSPHSVSDIVNALERMVVDYPRQEKAIYMI